MMYVPYCKYRAHNLAIGLQSIYICMGHNLKMKKSYLKSTSCWPTSLRHYIIISPCMLHSMAGGDKHFDWWSAVQEIAHGPLNTHTRTHTHTKKWIIFRYTGNPSFVRTASGAIMNIHYIFTIIPLSHSLIDPSNKLFFPSCLPVKSFKMWKEITSYA